MNRDEESRPGGQGGDLEVTKTKNNDTPDTDVDTTALDRVHAELTRYIAFPTDHAAVAVALWIAATHCIEAFDHATRLVITSPQKRCGKTTLMDILEFTCSNVLVSADASTAAIFRSITEQYPPTLLIDEADLKFGTRKAAEANEDLRGLINAGFERGRPTIRCVGPNQTPTKFPTFAMAALAGIGALPDTIEDRSVRVLLHRRTGHQEVAKFRRSRVKKGLVTLQGDLAKWANGRLSELENADPDMPVEDRAADVWEPLIAIADAAGGTWPERARAACLVLTREAGAADDAASLGVRLLEDIKKVMIGASITSGDLVQHLQGLDHAPWAGYEITTHKLAKWLRDFGIFPNRIDRPGENQARGYKREQFETAWAAYLTEDTADDSDDTAAPEPSSETVKPSDSQVSPQTVHPQLTVASVSSDQSVRDLTRADDGLTVSDGAPPGRRAGLAKRRSA